MFQENNLVTAEKTSVMESLLLERTEDDEKG